MPSQARKHVTQNEALLIPDTLIQLFVGIRQIAAPPTGAADRDSNTSGPRGRGLYGSDGERNLFERRCPRHRLRG